VWTPRELRDVVLDEFERNGMTATQFAAQLGVKYPTFASWVQQRRKSRGDTKSLRWLEATVPSKLLTVHLLGGALGGGGRLCLEDEDFMGKKASICHSSVTSFGDLCHHTEEKVAALTGFEPVYQP
jgi:hypothetical protein